MLSEGLAATIEREVGRAQIVFSGAGLVDSVIEFTKPYATAPKVFISPNMRGTLGSAFFGVSEITKTSFKLSGNKTNSGSVTVYVDWVAIK